MQMFHVIEWEFSVTHTSEIDSVLPQEHCGTCSHADQGRLVNTPMILSVQSCVGEANICHLCPVWIPATLREVLDGGVR